MFFNPLFISSTNTNTSVDVTKENKFTNSNYLFADIINVSKENVSFGETTVKLDDENKALFEDCNITLVKEGGNSKIQFTGNTEELSAFLANVLDSKIKQNNEGLKKQNNKTSDLSVIPEHVAQLVDVINSGDKLSIPLENSDGTIFVEIEKSDRSLATKENISKGIKLGTSSNNDIQFSKLNFKQVVDNISSTLRKSFNSQNSELDGAKVEGIIKKIENSFSSLVSVNNETFQPQKNILGNLVSSVEKDFNLNASESGVIKNTIVTEFAKVINEYIENENSVTQTLPKENKEVSSIDVTKLSVFTEVEQRLIDKFEVTLVNSNEIKEKIKLSLAENESNDELKSILNKFEDYLSPLTTEKNKNTQNGVFKKQFSLKEITKELNLTPKEVEIVKNVTSKNISLPELIAEVKSETLKPNATLELKNFTTKLDKYLAMEKPISTVGNTSEKLPLKEITKELNLTPKEVEIVKNVTSKNISLPELSAEVKSETLKPNATLELKNLTTKLDKYLAMEKPISTVGNTSEKLSLKEIAKELNLTPKEVEIIKKLDVEQIDVAKLTKAIKSELVRNSNQPELKQLLNKIVAVETLPHDDIIKLDSNVRKPKIIEKVKSGIKNILTNSGSEIAETNNSNVEYSFTLKNKKTSDSVVVTDDVRTKKMSPELLKTSIYTSKETAELTNVRVLPINTEVVRHESKENNHELNKIVTQKNFKTITSNSTKNNHKKDSSANDTLLGGEQKLDIQKIDSTKFINSDFSIKLSEEERKNLESVGGKNVELSDKSSSEITTKHKTSNPDTILPRTSLVEHQIRNNIFSISEKVTPKRVNIKNIKEEISNLISKGEKKSIEFQLNPENLGKMAVKLEVVNKIVTASIKVDNEITQQLIQNSLEGLKASLNNNGVQFNSLNVSLSYSEDKNQKYFKQKRKNNNQTHSIITEVDEKFVRKNLGYNNYDFIA